MITIANVKADNGAAIKVPVEIDAIYNECTREYIVYVYQGTLTIAEDFALLYQVFSDESDILVKTNENREQVTRKD